MSWEDEIKGITIGTLFKFYGKNLVASILWIVLMYIAIMIPVGLMMAAMVFFIEGVPGW